MSKEHFPRNLKQWEIAKEVPNPDKVNQMQEPPMLGLIYKALFYCLSVLMDIRHNTSHLNKNAGKKFKKVENPVLKDSDLKNIKVDKK